MDRASYPCYWIWYCDCISYPMLVRPRNSSQNVHFGLKARLGKMKLFLLTWLGFFTVNGSTENTNWFACGFAPKNLTILEIRPSLSPILCASLCNQHVNCEAILWKGTEPKCGIVSKSTSGSALNLAVGTLFVKNKSSCTISGMGLPMVTLALNSTNNCRANATSFNKAYPPCDALRTSLWGFSSSESLSNIPEWWYTLNATCMIDKILVRQPSSSQNMSIYVLPSLSSPRNPTSLCYQQKSPVTTSITYSYTCEQLLSGNFVVITRERPGSLSFWYLEIHGLCP